MSRHNTLAARFELIRFLVKTEAKEALGDAKNELESILRHLSVYRMLQHISGSGTIEFDLSRKDFASYRSAVSAIFEEERGFTTETRENDLRRQAMLTSQISHSSGIDAIGNNDSHETSKPKIEPALQFLRRLLWGSC